MVGVATPASTEGSERANAKVKLHRLGDTLKLPKTDKKWNELKLPSWGPRVIKQCNKARSIQDRTAN